MDLRVTKTLNGKGIVAARDFVPDEMLYEVTGPFVTCDEDEDMDETERSNAFRFDEDFYISPRGTIGDFQNHSCEPNAKVVKLDGKLFVIAAAAIPEGAEVLIDYATIVAADDVWQMACNCGASACRGSVSGFDELPAALRKSYVSQGLVPDYILKISAG